MTLRLCLLAPLVGATLALGACGHHEPADPPVASTSRYAAVARGVVDVTGGMLPVYPATAGIVVRVPVHDQQKVRAGQVLFALDATGAHASLLVARAHLAAATAQVAAVRAALGPAARRAKRLAAAAAANAAPAEDAETAAAALARLRAQLEGAQAHVREARAGVAQARYQLDLYTVRAPVAGTVVAKHLQRGQRVSPQQVSPLLEILPARSLIVRAELNEAYADAVHPGMQAQVSVDSGGGKPYPAHVLRVGLVFGPTRLGRQNDQPSDVRDVDCVLELDARGLRVGQRVLVRVLPDKRS